jgi:hypothetical protein
MAQRKNLFLTGLAFLFCLTAARAQFFSSGQDPASVRWEQINTVHFKVIYPDNYKATANHVANVLEYAASLDTLTLQAKAKKIPVILHNNTVVSNAQVVWAPRRMNFYTTPPQDSYGQEWFQQLSLHEYRHVIQVSKLNQGLTKVLTFVFGEQITGAVLGLYIPLWFLEGDAVATETELSQTGRGRSPAFAMPLRAQFLEKKIYPYDKAVFGSYKDFVPDHYILGYHIVAKAREAYGTEIWSHTLDKTGKHPYMVVPFSEGIRDISGMNKTSFYTHLMNELKNEWRAQAENTPPDAGINVLSPAKNIFTQYHRPHQTPQNTIIAEKKALDDIARFVEIDEKGNEKVIRTPGYYFDGSLTCAGNLIAWNEYAFDPRWENRNYAVIKTLDLETGKVETLSKKSRYFAPSLSVDGEKIVAVEITGQQVFKLVILEAATGKVIQEISSPENEFLSYPSFSNDSKTIVATAIGDSGNRIVRFDAETGNMDYLTGPDFTNISSPVFQGNNIVFVAAWSGINNLYRLDPDSKQISQLTSVEYGITDPFVSSGGNLLFSNYTSDGYEIAEKKMPEEDTVLLSDVHDQSVKLYQVLADQAGAVFDPAKIPEVQYESGKYSKAANLFKFHSWAPASIDVNNYDISPGISLLSQNILSSAFTSLGWEYDLNEETGKYYFNFTYEGWYPAFDLKMDYGERKSFTLDSAGNRIDYSWMETGFSATARLPLNFTTNRYARFFQPSVEFEYLQMDMDRDAEVSFRRSNYKTLGYRLYVSNLLKRSPRDMNPRWGQILDLNYRTAPFANDTLGSMLAAETRLFFPGAFHHHSFNVYGGYQKRFDPNPLFSNIVRLPRGFSGIYVNRLSSLAVNYKFPVFYPDVSLSSLAYLKRVKANIFYDYAQGHSPDLNNSWQSAGIELFVDLHILRFLAPIELGYRFIYRPELNDVRSEFLFSVNFGGFY